MANQNSILDEALVPVEEDAWDVCVRITIGNTEQTLSILSLSEEKEARDIAAVLAMKDAVFGTRLAQRLTGVSDDDLETRESLSLEYLGLYKRTTTRVRQNDPTPSNVDVERLLSLIR